MTSERFKALAAAYGADIGRWPADDRAAAQKFASNDEASAALKEASSIDALLEGYRLTPPSPALYARIVASAATVPPRRLLRRPGLWWPGLGLATLGMAGALAGALLVATLPQLMPMREFGWDYDASTAFGELGIGQES